MPSRGEIWLIDLDPTRGHEEAGRRPALVVSTNPFNHGPARLAVIVPLTKRDRSVPLRVRIEPPDGGVRITCFAICEAVRSVSTDRFVKLWGAVESRTMAEVEDRLRILLEL